MQEVIQDLNEIIEILESDKTKIKQFVYGSNDCMFQRSSY